MIYNDTTFSIILSIVVIILSLFLSWRIISRSSRKPQIIALESLRFIAILLVIFTLRRPEYVSLITTTEDPELVILVDDSLSMTTQDISDTTKEGAISRSDWIQKQLKSPILENIRKKFKVSEIPFSVKPSDTIAEKNATDFSYALGERLSGFNNLRSIILLSDGDHNYGNSAIGKASELAAAKIPVHTVLVGSPRYLPDIVLKEVKAPTICLANERVSIPFQLHNRFNQEVRLKVSLEAEGYPAIDKEVFLAPGSTLLESIVWIPPATGKHKLKIKVPVFPGELDSENNYQDFSIDVKQELLKVLIVDSVPRWEYRYLRNALQRDPSIQVETLLWHPELGVGHGLGYINSFPSTKEAISKYDVIFVGDIGIGKGELSKDNAELIKGLVDNQGSGVVFLPGPRGRHTTWIKSPFDEMLPVELDGTRPKGICSSVETKFQLTERGANHLLTLLSTNASRNYLVWKNLPGFSWCAAVKKLRSGAELLAVNSVVSCEIGRMPILAIRSFGNGSVLFMGIDSAWKWRRGVEDLYHYRFWGQVVRWMAHKRHLSADQGIRLFYTPETPAVDQSIYLNATLHHRSGLPIQKAIVTATILDPEGKQFESFDFTEADGEWGVYQKQIKFPKPGTYKISIQCLKEALTLDSEIIVGKTQIEQIGIPAKPSVLKEISRATRGMSVTTADFAQFVEKINSSVLNHDLEKRLLIWCQWWWGLIILSLFSIYWALRKMLGLV